MAYTLRLPDALDAAARSKADYLGISLNALFCVALDAYLSPSKVILSQDLPLVAPDLVNVAEPVKLSRKEKQAIYEAGQRERKLLFSKR